MCDENPERPVYCTGNESAGITREKHGTRVPPPQLDRGGGYLSHQTHV